MSSFTVHTPTLAVAAVTISTTAASVTAAQSAAASAAGQEGAFGGEPIGSAFASMCTRAQTAMSDLEQTLHSLSGNVAAAAVGYLVTDQGVVPISALHEYGGFKP